MKQLFSIRNSGRFKCSAVQTFNAVGRASYRCCQPCEQHPIAVGSLGFVERVKSKLRSRAMHRTVEHELGAYALPNREEPYVAALRWLRID